MTEMEASEMGRTPRDLPTPAQSIGAYFRNWRYQSSAIVVCFLSMYLGWIALAGGFAPGRAAIATAAASTLCMVLAIFLINDAADRDIDSIVHPERPIPRGLSNWKHIYGAGIGLIVVALVLAALLGLRFFAAVALLASLAMLYYLYFKRFLPLPGASELIAPMISALFPVTAFAVATEVHGALLLAVAAFIYFADLAQDLLGGIHDEAGDRRYHVRTFAIACGASTTRWISAAAFVVAVAAGLAVLVRGQLGWIYLVTFALLSIVMLRQYLHVLRADAASLPRIAGHANHLGGAFYFVVSASILPDVLLRWWMN